MARRGAAAMAAAAREEEEASPPQRLVEAALRGDVAAVEACLAAAADDAGGGLREEAAAEVIVEFRELKTDVSPLFAAAHAGQAEVVRTLLSAGADVNQKLFLGYATTAAAREGNKDILAMLLQAGATQEACEHSLSEAILFAEAESARLLVCSEMIGPEAATHALVTASSGGFDDVVVILLQNGVDVNSMARVLLRSVKPVLHANVNCTPLVAAVMGRQISTVKLLIEEGSYLDCLVQVSSWCWDAATGEELRVGACLVEKYNVIWCAVECYESSGEILKLLLDKAPWLLETPRKGRNLLCHAILCQNLNAVSVLLHAGANARFPIMTKLRHVSYPIHFAARLGYAPVLKQLMLDGAQINAQTSTGDTPLMISARSGHSDCFLELIKFGADLGMVNNAGDSAMMLGKKSSFRSAIVDILSRALSSGACITTSDISVFSPLHYFAASDSPEALLMMLHYSAEDLNKLDGSGLTPVMVAAESGHADIFRLLVMAGADIAVTSAEGKTVMSIIRSRTPETRDFFEQMLLQASLASVITSQTSFRPPHYAARMGDVSSLLQLLKMGHDPNSQSQDEDGYTPLMHAAAAGKLGSCKALVSHGGADCGVGNGRNETALSVARNSGRSKKATEEWLLDHLQSRAHVLAGEELMKHTRGGRGSPPPPPPMRSGVLTWGATRRRNVACREARAGPSAAFARNRKASIEAPARQLIILVETVTGREIHFEASRASSVELWVRGINLVVYMCAWSRAQGQTVGLQISSSVILLKALNL
uniref:Uncharacterized protein n=1 Tax=Oryza brachyantha TaxID=4533 RepID=J3LCK1_ORYBR